MSGLKLVLEIIYILVCIAITVIVLRQEGNDGGLSGALTGASETYWAKNKGRSIEGTLERATKILMAAFIVLSVLLCLKIW
jgi:preprotein translocase subunit SecG